MVEKSLITDADQNFNIALRGDLSIRGRKGIEIHISGDEFEIEENKSGLFLNGSGDLAIDFPSSMNLNILSVLGDCSIENHSAKVEIVDVKGDLSLKGMNHVQVSAIFGDLIGRNINGSLTIEELKGDAILRNMGGINVGEISGDLKAINVDGNVILQNILGDIKLYHIDQDVEIDSGGRDLNLRNIAGLLKVREVSGDIRLRGGLAPGKHQLNALGDIVIHWPRKIPLLVEAKGSEIRNRLALEVLANENGYFSGRIGSGETILILNAEGRIILKEDSDTQSWESFPEFESDLASDLEGLGLHIADEINSRLTEWSARLEKEFGPAFTEQIEKTAQAASTRAERAAEKAVRKAEKAARKASWYSDQYNWSPKHQPSGTRANETDGMDEERLKILRMVEKGIISPDEASNLLEAIEG